MSDISQAQMDLQFELWVIEQLEEGLAVVDFIKKDGTQRTMNCTLKYELIPEGKRPVVKETVIEIKPTRPEAVRVFDTDKQDWRSFRWDSLRGLTVNGNKVFTLEDF